MTFYLSPSVPRRWRPTLCLVRHQRGIEWMVLYHHSRKGWCFKEGLGLSSSHSVIKWAVIEEEQES